MSATYAQRTKDELQDELRERDLPVSGTKDELVERLEDDDESRGDGAPEADSRHRGDGGSGDPDDREGLRPMEAVRLAGSQLGELRQREVDGVCGFERVDGGWVVLVELVEVSRVPSSTDVVGTYEVRLDGEGELVGYERLRRYVRGRTGETEGVA